jgi:hypothetical protein
MYSKHPIVTEAMKKSAALPSGTKMLDFGKKMLAEHPGPTLALAGTALSLGASTAYSGYEVVRNAVQKSMAFKDMLQQNPALRDHSDQPTVRKYFDSLHRMNPHFMNDPHFAGAQVHNVLEAQRSLGGSGQAPLALATAMSELAQGRGKFVQALEAEARNRPNFGRIEQSAQQVGQLMTSIKEEPFRKMREDMDDRARKHEKNLDSRQQRADKIYEQRADQVKNLLGELSRVNQEIADRKSEIQGMGTSPSARERQRIARGPQGFTADAIGERVRRAIHR